MKNRNGSHKERKGRNEAGISDSLYLKCDFVQLSEGEDGFLHHIHTFILQQHVQVGDESEEELVVSFTESR